MEEEEEKEKVEEKEKEEEEGGWGEWFCLDTRHTQTSPH